MAYNYRSLSQPFVQWILKEYDHWTLLLNEDQHYLGRSYVWLAREGGMQRLSELSDAEYTELKIVMHDYEKAMKKLWNPDFMNYAWLANLFSDHGGHGHLHLIPRYKDERIFADTKFIDGRWGKNYSPSEEFKPSEEVMLGIKNTLKNELNHL